MLDHADFFKKMIQARPIWPPFFLGPIPDKAISSLSRGSIGK
jgi:hypothetical protein